MDTVRNKPTACECGIKTHVLHMTKKKEKKKKSKTSGPARCPTFK